MHSSNAEVQRQCRNKPPPSPFLSLSFYFFFFWRQLQSRFPLHICVRGLFECSPEDVTRAALSRQSSPVCVDHLFEKPASHSWLWKRSFALLIWPQSGVAAAAAAGFRALLFKRFKSPATEAWFATGGHLCLMFLCICGGKKNAARFLTRPTSFNFRKRPLCIKRTQEIPRHCHTQHIVC